MVDTIKFSQMTNAGNINNNDIVPSLRSGENVILNNPWTFLPPGTTAQRPAPSATINYRLRFNTDTQVYEYYNAVLAEWTQLQQDTFIPGPFITYTADINLPDAQNLGALANGILKQTISSGIATLAIAVPGTDYYAGNSDIDLMNAHRVINALDPINAQDYATRHYVDQTALNGTSVYAMAATGLGTVTQSGAGVGATLTNAGTQVVLTLDGVQPPVGVNVLIPFTATGMTSANEGIYTVTDTGSASSNWILTRATSYDSPEEINLTGLIVIQNGSTLAGTAWYNTTTIVTVDTTAFDYAQFGNIIFPINVPQGGTGNTSFTAYGLIAGGTTSTGNLQNVGTGALHTVLMGNGSAALPFFSTATYPATTTINQLLYSSANNTIAGLPTVNSAVLSTSSGGVPSFSTTLPASLTLPSPLVTTGIYDVNNNVMLGFNPAASAVNYIQIQNAGAGNNPSLAAVGASTNVAMNLFAQGNAGINLQAFADASDAPSGVVGYFASVNLPTASAITLVANTPTNVLTLSLPAGDFDVYGNLDFQPTGIIETLQGWSSVSSATSPDDTLTCRVLTAAAANGIGFCVPMLREKSSVPFTVYLSALSSSTPKVGGTLQARSRR